MSARTNSARGRYALWAWGKSEALTSLGVECGEGGWIVVTRGHMKVYWKIAVGLSFGLGLPWSLIFVSLSMACRANLANEAL
jgi:hypothetical protein